MHLFCFFPPFFFFFSSTNEQKYTWSVHYILNCTWHKHTDPMHIWCFSFNCCVHLAWTRNVYSKTRFVLNERTHALYLCCEWERDGAFQAIYTPLAVVLLPLPPLQMHFVCYYYVYNNPSSFFDIEYFRLNNAFIFKIVLNRFQLISVFVLSSFLLLRFFFSFSKFLFWTNAQQHRWREMI